MGVNTRDYDVILWGCTGFTGKLTAIAFARQFGLSHPSMRMALAGRSEYKLKEVAELMLKESLDSDLPDVRQQALQLKKMCEKDSNTSLLPTIVLPAYGLNDKLTEELCRNFVSSTQVLISLAGPFSLIGEPILKACAEQGTDYVDVTGEFHWVKLMYERYNKLAKQNKCRIIPCCGVGYLLNDIGLAALQKHVTYLDSTLIPYVEQYLTIQGSKISHGTLRSGLEYVRDKPLKSILYDTSVAPYEMCQNVPTTSMHVIQSNEASYIKPTYSKLNESWMYPSPLGKGCVRYIHWTNEIKNYIYGRSFSYKVGEETSSFFLAMMRTLIFTLQIFIIKAVSMSRFLSEKLSQLIQKTSENSVSLEAYEKPTNFVQLKTVARVKAANSSETQKLEHSIRFDKREGYLMTAYGTLNVALACLTKRKNEDEGVFGVGCPSLLLGTTIEDQLRLGGFQMSLRLNDE